MSLGTIFLTAGSYVLSETVVIDRSSVEIRGENMGGDLFFASDGFYQGFMNKTATVIVAPDETVILLTSPHSMPIETPTKGRGTCAAE